MTRSLAKGSLLALGLLGAAAGTAAAQQRASGVGDIPFQTYQLSNGLKVILIPDHSAPVTAVDLWYNVGSRNEVQGRTGFAHLFEHMMFEGSANVPKGQHMALLQQAGSSNFNGTTSEDRTNYYEVVPSNRVNLALWLEADRMRALNVSEANLTNQRSVVKEEKRMRVDNAPYANSLRSLLSDASYGQSCFSYGHTTIGSMEDLDSASLGDVQAFFKQYYAPNNATLAISGDFDDAQVRQLVQQYFGDIPSVPTPPAVTCERPFAQFPSTKTVQDPNATLPAFLEAYGAVASGSPDSYALELLGTVLAGGQSSRLNQRLVKTEKAATFVLGGTLLRRGPGLFAVYAGANQGYTPQQLQAVIDQEVEKIRNEGITPAELQLAKNQKRAETIRSLQTAIGRAEAIQEFALFRGDPSQIRTDLDKYMAVTTADVQRVARQYLNPNNRSVIYTVPAPKS
jgi:predicted Zn-dependent peptidase